MTSYKYLNVSIKNYQDAAFFHVVKKKDCLLSIYTNQVSNSYAFSIDIALIKENLVGDLKWFLLEEQNDFRFKLRDIGGIAAIRIRPSSTGIFNMFINEYYYPVSTALIGR